MESLLPILARLRHLVPEVQHLQQGLWQGSLGRQLSGKKSGRPGFAAVDVYVHSDNNEFYIFMTFDSINAFTAGHPQNMVFAPLPARPS
jgi:hypothetical protein